MREIKRVWENGVIRMGNEHKKKRKRTVRKKKKRNTILKMSLVFAILGMFVLGAVLASAGLTVYKQADLSTFADGREPTIIYDRDGGVLEELSNSRVDYVSISVIPQSMRDAIIAIEDTRFQEHVGVDPL